MVYTPISLENLAVKNTNHYLKNGGRFCFILWENIRAMVYIDIILIADI